MIVFLIDFELFDELTILTNYRAIFYIIILIILLKGIIIISYNRIILNKLYKIIEIIDNGIKIFIVIKFFIKT